MPKDHADSNRIYPDLMYDFESKTRILMPDEKGGNIVFSTGGPGPRGSNFARFAIPQKSPKVPTAWQALMYAAFAAPASHSVSGIYTEVYATGQGAYFLEQQFDRGQPSAGGGTINTELYVTMPFNPGFVYVEWDPDSHGRPNKYLTIKMTDEKIDANSQQVIFNNRCPEVHAESYELMINNVVYGTFSRGFKGWLSPTNVIKKPKPRVITPFTLTGSSVQDVSQAGKLDNDGVYRRVNYEYLLPLDNSTIVG